MGLQAAGAIFLLFELKKPFLKPFQLPVLKSSRGLSEECLMQYAAIVQWEAFDF
jgi:hypothetical protein